jgi:hypothetical protein
MALTDPQDTLAYHSSRVLCQHRDMTKLAIPNVAMMVKTFMNKDLEANTLPEREAFWFYGMNHGVSLISASRAPLEPLPAEELAFIKDYHEAMAPKAVRAFYYLLLICTKEFRHHKSWATDKTKAAALFGTSVADWITVNMASEQVIHNALISKPPTAHLGTFVKCLKWGFDHGKWQNGFGGKKWGNVTDCLLRFVTGEFTAEMMLDTVWTLCHNGGPIFNKGMLYGHYGQNIVRLLDIQRSGQIPEAILEADKPLGVYMDTELVGRMTWLRDYFPGKIGAYVDWYQVQALGAVGEYPTDQKNQLAKYGPSPIASKMDAIKQAKLAAEAAKQKAAEEAAAKAAEEYKKTHFEVMPGVVVKKMQPKREAA